MIESEEGLANIEEIAATEGVDVISVGTSDLTGSMGVNGDFSHPRVTEAWQKIAAAAKRHGKGLRLGGVKKPDSVLIRTNSIGWNFVVERKYSTLKSAKDLRPPLHGGSRADGGEMERATTRLRSIVARSKLTMAPGVADAMAARVVAKEGYEALYMTGSGTAAVRIGLPDVGLLTMTEMVDNAERIADAAEIPLIADADTGYGNPLNVMRTVRAYERAGVAAIHIEDQEWPKRCGHFAGKALIPAEEMENKIKAAVDARHDSDFMIIARTDAYSVEGYDAALERAARYVEAGADVIFVEELRTVEQLAQVPQRFGVPALYNMGGSGKTPFLTAAEIEALGFRLVIYPNFIMRAAIAAMQNVLRELKSTGSLEEVLKNISGYDERHELLKLPEMIELQRKYGISAVRYGKGS